MIAFCVKCQAETEHHTDIDKHNELVLTCMCSHFIKLPAVPPTQVKAWLVTHRQENEGRKFLDPAVEAAKVEAKQAYLKALASV